MIKHVFVFEGGVAKIKDAETGEIQLAQPGLPGPEGITPWASEEEAHDWVYSQFESWFIDYPESVPVIINVPEEQTPSEESGA